MKRWLIGVFLFIATCPSLALALPHAPKWVPPAERQPITGFPLHGGILTPPYDGDALRGARFLGPAHLGMIGVNVAMQMRDEPGLLRYARLVSDPHSLYYRHFLTPQQLADFFGASPVDYTTAVRYFWSQGLGVRSWAQRQMLRVVGTQANMEQAFQTRFGWFSKNGVVFYAPVTAPRFHTPLAVRGVGGMVAYHRFRKHFGVGKPFRPFAGLGPGLLIGNSPFDLAAAFDYTGAYGLNGACCKGDGITIGVVGTGPISGSDVPTFRSTFTVAGTGTVQQINVTQVVTCCYSTGLVTAPPVTAPCIASLPACNPEDIEAQLDTEQTSSLAPNAMVNFYLAYNPNECFAPGPCAPGTGVPSLGIAETDDEWQQIIHDNVADVVSASFGIGELDFAGPSNPILTCPAATVTGCSGAEPTIFASLAAEGIAVFISSGDTGASGCQRDGNPATADILCVSYPSGDPNVVSVGGTTTPIGSDGRLTGLITTWGVQTQTFGASGGGFSTFLNRPAFQPSGSICDNEIAARCDSTHRLQPDVSLNADFATGVTVIIDSGPGLGGMQIGSVGGTSAAAPDMAAMWALVLQACRQAPSCATHGGAFGAAHAYRLGNPAQLLYALTGSPKTAAFYDVNFGLNAVPPLGSTYPSLDPGFNARTGWDAATGLGAPFARNLIKAIVGI